MKTQYPHIIESSRSLPFLLLLRDIILTALCWLLYIYFLRDAFAFFRDVGLYVASGFQGYDSYASFAIVDTLILYAEIIAISNLVYFLWALYNKIRFGNATRRRSAPAVTAEEVGTRFKLNPRDVESWQKAQTLVVHHDKDGRITNIVKV
jgi:poly-beta-1,6-N-acetyl-D-glucosamine biosynthesis protein PgaD